MERISRQQDRVRAGDGRAGKADQKNKKAVRVGVKGGREGGRRRQRWASGRKWGSKKKGERGRKEGGKRARVAA